MGTHRYWKFVNTTGSNNANYISCATLQFEETVGGADQALGLAGFGPFFAAGFEPAKAFDNNNSTYFFSNGAVNSYLGIDFGVGVAHDLLQFTWRCEPSTGVSGPKDIQVYFSDDNVTYTFAFGFNGLAWGAGEVKTFTSPAVPSQPDFGQVAILGVEQISPSQIDIGQIVILGILEGPPNSIALGPAITLPCWQPCTAFGTEARVIIFK